MFFLGCASKSDLDDVKSPLNYLNGEHYDVNPGALSTPYLLAIPAPGPRSNKISHIRGRLYIKEGLIFSPLNHKKLTLLDDQKRPVAEVMSGVGGEFEFSERIPNGKYSIQLNELNYEGEIEVALKTYEMNNLKIIAKPVSEKP